MDLVRHGWSRAPSTQQAAAPPRLCAHLSPKGETD